MSATVGNSRALNVRLITFGVLILIGLLPYAPIAVGQAPSIFVWTKGSFEADWCGYYCGYGFIPYDISPNNPGSASGYYWTTSGSFGDSTQITYTGYLHIDYEQEGCPYGCQENYYPNTGIDIYVKGPAGTHYAIQYSEDASGSVTQVSCGSMRVSNNLFSIGANAGESFSDSRSYHTPQPIEGFTTRKTVEFQGETYSYAMSIGAGPAINRYICPDRPYHFTGSADSTVTISITANILASGAQLSPTALHFDLSNGQPPPQQVTLSSIGNSALNMSGVSVTGNFVQSNDCPSSLAVGQHCTIQVSYDGNRNAGDTGVLRVSDDAPNSPQTAALTADCGSNRVQGRRTLENQGQCGGPAAQVSPSSLHFDLTNGLNPPPQNVVVTSVGTLPLHISGVGITGNFTQTSDCGSVLAIGQHCTIQVTYNVNQNQNDAGTLSITDDAPDSPQSVLLRADCGGNACSDEVDVGSLPAAEVGLLVSGKVGNDYWHNQITGPTTNRPVNLGVNVTDNPGFDEVIGFNRAGQPPSIVRADWTEGRDVISMTFPSTREVPLVFWIVSGGDPVRQMIQDSLSWAQAIWLSEGLGYIPSVLVDPQKGLAVYDMSKSNAPEAQYFRQNGFHCSPTDLTYIFKRRWLRPTDGVINVFFFKDIFNSRREKIDGLTCTAGAYTLIALPVDPTYYHFDSLVHELGHELGLGHTYGDPQVKKFFDHFNVMWGHEEGATLSYFSEGQIFRANFRKESALHSVYKGFPSITRNCPPLDKDKNETAAALVDTIECPALQTRIWPDGDLKQDERPTAPPVSLTLDKDQNAPSLNCNPEEAVHGWLTALGDDEAELNGIIAQLSCDSQSAFLSLLKAARMGPSESEVSGRLLSAFSAYDRIQEILSQDTRHASTWGNISVQGSKTRADFVTSDQIGFVMRYRLRAIAGLLSVGGPDSAAALTSLTHDPDQTIREAAEAALTSLLVHR